MPPGAFGGGQLAVEFSGAAEVLSGDVLLAGFDRAPGPCVKGPGALSFIYVVSQNFVLYIEDQRKKCLDRRKTTPLANEKSVRLQLKSSILAALLENE